MINIRNRLGFVVEDISGIEAVPALLTELGLDHANPMCFRGQPTQCDQATLRRFIKEKITRIVLLVMRKQVDKIIVVIDLEDRVDCPGIFADFINRNIIDELIRSYSYCGYPRICTVVSNRTFENWLISDPPGIKRLSFIRRDISSAIGNNADGKDAISLLKRAYSRTRKYIKTRDAAKIAQKVRVDLNEVRSRSKSLDKLIRECSS